MFKFEKRGGNNVRMDYENDKETKSAKSMPRWK